jgi:hypothetical protein
MLRYLRGKGFLDVLYDSIRWVAPGRIGMMLATVIVITIGLTYMYVRNYSTLARWF